jgi:tRNA threonylcarbamoyl adenosine modification protein YeaZ
MKFLILDTATDDLLVEAVDYITESSSSSASIKPIASRSIHNLPLSKHSESFFVHLEDLLKEVSSFDQLIVGVGPGSYTGARIAATAAQTLAFAWNIPLIQIPSLYALIAPEEVQNLEKPILLANHAGGGKHYCLTLSTSIEKNAPLPLPEIFTSSQLQTLLEASTQGTFITLKSQEPIYSNPKTGPSCDIHQLKQWQCRSAEAHHLLQWALFRNKEALQATKEFDLTTLEAMPYVQPTPYKPLASTS